MVWWPKMRLEVLVLNELHGGCGSCTDSANKSAMRLQNNTGYSASVAVSYCREVPTLVMRHGSCSCCPSHCPAKAVYKPRDARRRVFLALFPPCMHIWKVTRSNCSYHSKKAGSSYCRTKGLGPPKASCAQGFRWRPLYYVKNIYKAVLPPIYTGHWPSGLWWPECLLSAGTPAGVAHPSKEEGRRTGL